MENSAVSALSGIIPHDHSFSDAAERVPGQERLMRRDDSVWHGNQAPPCQRSVWYQKNLIAMPASVPYF